MRFDLKSGTLAVDFVENMAIRSLENDAFENLEKEIEKMNVCFKR